MTDTTTTQRTIPPAALAELRTRCATITRMASEDVWSLAKVHQLRVFAGALYAQIVTLSNAGLIVGPLLPLSERLLNAVDRRSRDEAQSAAAALTDRLEGFATGDPSRDDALGITAAPLPIPQDVASPLAPLSAIAPVREHSVVSADALAAVHDIGTRVRQARLASGMSQGQLATAAGVGRRFLAELEAGKPSLEIGRVLMVCMVAGVSLVPPVGTVAA